MASCTATPTADQDTNAQAKDQIMEPVFFELRTYYCHPDKLENLLTRFEDHTMTLFEKHGMVNMGYWLPIDNSENKLVYLLGYQNRTQRDEAWDAFMNDSEWIEVWEASKSEGPIVESVKNQFFNYTDYSPILKVENGGPRVFSIRTYYTNEGKLSALHDRFRDHTLKIFEDNGMTNLAYFNLDTSHQESENVLTYLISFPDTIARAASWKSFSQDPNWKDAYANSIKDGKLVDSLTAELMLATPFSPIKVRGVT